jgi:[acyl-carrier-protein] S-malonyltransferase
LTKVAWVFPGQGSQAVGMGKDIYDEYPQAREVFDLADEALGFSLSRVIFEGPEERLTLTEYAQPALLTVSVACAAVLRDEGLRPDMVAGLSLGEYTALVISGSLSFSDAVILTHNRGLYMQEACPQGQGAMTALLGMSPEDVEELCTQARSVGEVAGANFNCPGQIVVSGAKEAVDAVVSAAKKRGKRVIPLNVSAPFHSPLMIPAARRLKADLDTMQVGDPGITVYSNVTGEPIPDAAAAREALILQVTAPVLWQKCIESMVRDGAGAFIEVGVGKTLTGFGKRTHPEIPYAQFSVPGELEAVLAFSKEALLR